MIQDVSQVEFYIAFFAFSNAIPFIAELYSDEDQQGFQYNTTDEIADLSDTQMDDSIQSACTTGMWVR